MHYNPGYPSDIIPLTPLGTNSTMFTMCCSVAICSDEKTCPNCHREVVGSNCSTDHEREIVRWRNATRYWKKR